MAPAVLLFHDFRFLIMIEGEKEDKDTHPAIKPKKSLLYFNPQSFVYRMHVNRSKDAGENTLKIVEKFVVDKEFIYAELAFLFIDIAQKLPRPPLASMFVLLRLRYPRRPEVCLKADSGRLNLPWLLLPSRT